MDKAAFLLPFSILGFTLCLSICPRPQKKHSLKHLPPSISLSPHLSLAHSATEKGEQMAHADRQSSTSTSLQTEWWAGEAATVLSRNITELRIKKESG